MARNPATPDSGFAVRSPREIPHQTPDELLRQWTEARLRLFAARYQGSGELDPNDLFIELAYGAWLAADLTSGRWCAIADLLRTGAVDSWAQVARAMTVTETEARDGFQTWIGGQLNLRRRTGTIGLTESEGAELTALAEAVAW